MKYAADLHRKGELSKVEAMEKVAKAIERKSKGGLGAAFITECYYGADAYCIIANSAAYQDQTGYVVYNNETEKAEFVPDEKE